MQIFIYLFITTGASYLICYLYAFVFLNQFYYHKVLATLIYMVYLYIVLRLFSASYNTIFISTTNKVLLWDFSF